MTAKTKGRPLPPLLPLEYCSIERAAKMLDCEIEDFYHWAEIGAIDLYLIIDAESTVMTLTETDHKALLLEIDKQNPKKSENAPSFLSVKIGLSCFWISAESLNNIGYDPETELYDLDIDHAKGHWAIEYSELEYSLKNGNKSFTPWALYVDTVGPNFIYIDLCQDLDFKLSQIQIVKRDLEKLYAAITTGEPLANKFNNPEIANERREREKDLNSNPKQDRLTPGKAKAVTALTELALRLAGEDAGLMNNPHKLHRRINELMFEHKANKDGGYNLGISDTAYRDLIGAGRSAQSKDGK